MSVVPHTFLAFTRCHTRLVVHKNSRTDTQYRMGKRGMNAGPEEERSGGLRFSGLLGCIARIKKRTQPLCRFLRNKREYQQGRGWYGDENRRPDFWCPLFQNIKPRDHQPHQSSARSSAENLVQTERQYRPTDDFKNHIPLGAEEQIRHGRQKQNHVRGIVVRILDGAANRTKRQSSSLKIAAEQAEHGCSHAGKADDVYYLLKFSAGVSYRWNQKNER
jgi:hypothetical protein